MKVNIRARMRIWKIVNEYQACRTTNKTNTRTSTKKSIGTSTRTTTRIKKDVTMRRRMFGEDEEEDDE